LNAKRGLVENGTSAITHGDFRSGNNGRHRDLKYLKNFP
jgi:hypothetical protein